MREVLLHTCCAPCAVRAVSVLRSEEYEPTLYFYNPNIHPVKEYKLRFDEVKKLSEMWNLEVIEGEYDVKRWYEAVKGYENEPEGGERCKICYRLRLEKTVRTALKLGFRFFATTLTTAPQKNAFYVNSAGVELERRFGIKFLVADFKKENGFLESVRISKELGLYRQSYCGCVFSFR